MTRQLLVARLGRVRYGDALELQRELARRRIAGELTEDVLLLLEHPPVVTLGRTAKEQHVTSSPEFLRSRGVEVFEVERGGDVTFHGPGQLVGYPIIDLKRHTRDLHWYLRQVEEALIRTVGAYGIPAERVGKYTGVWTRGRDAAGASSGSDGGNGPQLRKIASIGVHVRDWVTWHGFALNVTTDLSFFDLIVPCGIQGVVMTSIARETGVADVALAGVEDAAARAFGELFSLAPVPVDAAALAEPAGLGAAGAPTRHP